MRRPRGHSRPHDQVVLPRLQEAAEYRGEGRGQCQGREGLTGRWSSKVGVSLLLFFSFFFFFLFGGFGALYLQILSLKGGNRSIGWLISS